MSGNKVTNNGKKNEKCKALFKRTIKGKIYSFHNLENSSDDCQPTEKSINLAKLLIPQIPDYPMLYDAIYRCCEPCDCDNIECENCFCYHCQTNMGNENDYFNQIDEEIYPVLSCDVDDNN